MCCKALFSFSELSLCANALLASCMALRFAEITSVDGISSKAGNLLSTLGKFRFFQITIDWTTVHEHWIVNSLHLLPAAN